MRLGTTISPPNENNFLTSGGRRGVTGGFVGGHSHHKSTVLNYKQEKILNGNKSQSFGLSINTGRYEIGRKIKGSSFEGDRKVGAMRDNSFLGNLYPEFGKSETGFGRDRKEGIVKRSQIVGSPKKVADSPERNFCPDELSALKEKARRLEGRKSELQGKLDRGLVSLESAKALQKISSGRPCSYYCNSNCEKTLFFIGKLKEADKCIRNLVSENDKLFTEFNELKLQRIKLKQSTSATANQMSNQLSKRSSFAVSHHQTSPHPTPDAKSQIQKLKTTINLLETNIATQYSEIKNFKSRSP